ncbi:MAG: nucleotidyltransferase family protein [Alphaproteobacteria bacterium]
MILEEEDIKIVKEILQKLVPNKKVIAFGSRVHGRNLKKFSDLDLAIYNVDYNTCLQLKDEFSASYLPIKVDVVAMDSCKQEFKKIILQDYEVIQE